MNVEQIKNIENLIKLQPGQHILSHTVKRLTAAGENYGSLMLSVELTVKTTNGKEKLSVVAKMVPPNEFIQEVFNTQVTFRNEIAFYKNIVPLLHDFQRENGIKRLVDFAPRYYGSRLSLDDGGTKVDADAALVLENLKLSNFVSLERTEGLDLDAAKLVIVNLAQFHAVPLALKLKKPEVFEKEIKPHLSPWQLLDHILDDVKNNLSRLIEQVEELKPLKERIYAAYDRIKEPYEVREPFGTITHNDCWNNNNMFQVEGGKVVKSKLVDYQICSYGSPAKDVIFFLYSSVKNHVVDRYYDELVRLYHETFLSTLQELNCDTTSFSFEALQKELDFEARYSQFGHIAFMLFPIYESKDRVMDILEMSPDVPQEQVISDLHKEKFLFFITQFVKRNWI